MNKTEEFIKQNELRKAKEQEEKAQAAAKKKKGGFKRFLCFLLQRVNMPIGMNL